MHGYVNPTLIDGLTKPHNPGIEYDLFLRWNQRRLDANEAALAAVGMGITRPVNQWNADAEPPGDPSIAEGWDDWGPFYTQTYMAFYGVDSSTLEMCSSGPGCDGRFGSKRAQYVGFYSSAQYWLENRNPILHDQLEIFRRGLTGAPRPNCCDDPLIASRNFTEDQHDWMVPYPKAFVIPFEGIQQAGAPRAQRSDAEANRLAQWLLDNGIQVNAATRKFCLGRQDVPDGLLRRLAEAAAARPGADGARPRPGHLGPDLASSTRRRAPGATGSSGGPTSSRSRPSAFKFNPQTVPVSAPNALQGGVRSGKAKLLHADPEGRLRGPGGPGPPAQRRRRRDRRGELRQPGRDDAGRDAHLPERRRDGRGASVHGAGGGRRCSSGGGGPSRPRPSSTRLRGSRSS